jgi:arginine N-succinyltransferase
MLVVRAAGPGDLDALMELAILSGDGFTSLPEHEPTLRSRLDLSQASFHGAVEDTKAWYTLVLEDTERGVVEGVAGVRAAVGVARPHFSFRVVTLAQSSPILEMRFDHRVLVLVNECTGWSEVGSLFLRKERRNGGAGRLLAQSRYMLIGAAPQKFGETVLAELRGWFDEDGSCPFWEHVAAKFFRQPFSVADMMSASTNGQFILDLAPRHPIYTDLLPPAACEAIGRVHREGVAAWTMLQAEGFRPNGLVDIFDAGPSLSVRRDDIRTVRKARALRAETGDVETEGSDCIISAAEIHDFRALSAQAVMQGEHAVLSRETLDALKVRPGELVRVKAFP